MKTLSTNQFSAISQPYKLPVMAWARMGTVLLVAVLVVGLLMAKMTSLGRAAPLAPSLRLTMVSTPAGSTQPSPNPSPSALLLPGAQVVYTITLANTGSTPANEPPNFVRDQLPPGMEIVSMNPAATAQSGDVQSGYVLTWTLSSLNGRQSFTATITAQVTDSGNVLKREFRNKADATLTDGTGSTFAPSVYLYHYLNVTAGVGKWHTTSVVTAGNTLQSAVPGEVVTMTALFTIPRGTVVYNAVPRLLVQDGLSVTGASETYVMTTGQAAVDVQKKQDVNLRVTQLEFAPRTITDTDSVTRSVAVTVYAIAHPAFFLGTTFPADPTADTNGLLFQPILRWCETDGCTVDFANARYYAENEVETLFIQRPTLINLSLTYSASPPASLVYPTAAPPSGGTTVRFILAGARNSGIPPAYDMVLNAVLGPGLSFVTSTNPIADSWAKVGDVTVITWTGASLAGSNTQWSVAPSIDATLPPTFAIGTNFTCTAHIRYNTLPGDVPYEGDYSASYSGAGSSIMPVGTPDQDTTPSDNVTIGDVVTYTIVIQVGGGTLLYNPGFTDTLPRGFHYLSGTVSVAGATLASQPITRAGALDGTTGKVKESLVWNVDTVDNTGSPATHRFTVTYQAVLSGLDMNGSPVYVGESKNPPDKYQELRLKQDARNALEFYWLAEAADSSSRRSFLLANQYLGYTRVAQPYLSTLGSGTPIPLFSTTRLGVENYEIGGQPNFQTVIRNSTQSVVPAYEVEVCDELPAGVEVYIVSPLSDVSAWCPGATLISSPHPGDQGKICWTINKVCPYPMSGSWTDFSLSYFVTVLSSTTPGLTYANKAAIVDYTSQVGDANSFDRHYGDFPSVVGTGGVVYPLALPFSASDTFKVIGLDVSKSTAVDDVRAGDLITYTLAYTDSGESTYTHLVITDSYDAYLEYVSASPAPDVADTTNRRLVWDVADVTAGRHEIELILRTVAVLPSALTAVTNTIAWDAQASIPAREQPPLVWTVTTPIQAPNPHVGLSGPSTTYAGDTVTYTVVYSNDGTSANEMSLIMNYGPYMHLVTYTASVTERVEKVSDSLFVDSAVPNDGLPCTLTLQMRVNTPLPYQLAEIHSGVTAEAAGAPPKSKEWVVALLRPIVNLQKKSDATPQGTLIPYSITVSNLGSYTATNLIFTDTWSANTNYNDTNTGLGWTNHGQYATYVMPELGISVSHAVFFWVNVVNNTTAFYTNTVSLSTDQSSAQTAHAKVWEASVATAKRASPDPAFPGRVLTYTVYYTNTGVGVLNVAITDTLPGGLSYLGDEHSVSGTGCASPGWQFTAPVGGKAVWTCAAMSAGAHGQLSIWGEVTAAEGEWLENETVSSGDGIPVRTIDEPLRTQVARPHLAVVMSADTRPVATGDLITYTLVYSNYGTEAAYETLVVDELPGGVDYVSCTGGCTHDGGVVRWSLNTVPVGVWNSLTLVVEASGAAPQTVTNADYWIESSKLSPAETTSGAPVSIDILAPHLTLVKTANPPTVSAPNEPIVYTVTFTNDGGGALHNVVISDVLSNLVGFTGASPACSHSGGVIGGVVTCLIGDLDQGESSSIDIQVQNATTVNGSEIVNAAQALATSHAQGLAVETDSEPVSVLYIDPGQCIPVWNPSFDVAPATLEAGEPITFSGQVYTGSLPINYTWGFGDGQTGVGQIAHHTYAVSGTYTVIMTASNTCAPVTYNRSTSRQIVVPGSPSLAVNPAQVDVALGAGGQTASTLVVSNTGSAGMAWSIAKPPAAAWLQVAPTSGALEAGASASVAVTFTAPVTQGVYLTTLTVDGGAGGSISVPVTMTVQAACVELESVSIAGAASVPGVYTFTASYLPSSATAPTYLWDNGDTGASSSRTLAVGVHTLMVTATNACSVRTDTHVVTITETGVEPTASFTPSATEVEIGEVIIFTNTSTGIPVPTYAWIFGDGGSSALANPSHSYGAAGEYTVILTATNAYGEDTAQAVITVRPAGAYAVYLPVVTKNQ